MRTVLLCEKYSCYRRSLAEEEEEKEVFCFNAKYKMVIRHMRFKSGSWNLLRKSRGPKLLDEFLDMFLFCIFATVQEL